MTTEQEQVQVCEACGCAGEMGFIIKEGDDVAEVTIFATGKALIEAELAKYVALAEEVCAGVKYEVTSIEEDATEVTARFQFEVSAEKLIFELKTRALAR